MARQLWLKKCSGDRDISVDLGQELDYSKYLRKAVSPIFLSCVPMGHFIST